MTRAELPEWMTEKVAREYLKYPESSFSRVKRDGLIVAVKTGKRRIRFRKSEVLRHADDPLAISPLFGEPQPDIEAVPMEHAVSTGGNVEASETPETVAPPSGYQLKNYDQLRLSEIRLAGLNKEMHDTGSVAAWHEKNAVERQRMRLIENIENGGD